MSAQPAGGVMIPDYPDYIWRDPDGYILYFGVPDGNVSLLPVGAVFDMLWTNTWNKVRWVAVEGVVKYGKHKGEWGRWYCVQQERYLDADESAVWTEYIDNWEENQMRLVDLQVAFHEMEAVLAEYDDSWIITVFPDNDPRVQGGSWQVSDMDNPPPTMWMSDDLYALYCASVGMVNEHQR